MVKFWLKRDFTNCAYMSQSLYFIAKVASGALLVVGLLFFSSVFESAQENYFKCGSLRASEFQGDL